MGIYIEVRCFINPRLGPPLPKAERGSLKEKIISLRGVILAILIVVLIMTGIYSLVRLHLLKQAA
jgi:hypothetical protein